MKFPFIGGAYTGRSLNANASTCKNFIIEPPSKGTDAMLVPRPGYSLLSTSNVGSATPIRGMVYPGSGNLIYAVQGNQLVTYNVSTAAWLVCGGAFTMSTSSGPVSMAVNSATTTGFLIVCDGTAAYSYDVSANTMINLTSIHGFVSNTVCFIDGRFVVDDQNTPGRFYYSNLYDGMSATALPFNFATTEGSPDYLRAVLADRRELWAFGDHSTEIWWHSGDANNPFQRSQGGFIEVGIAARYSAAKCDNSIIWLAKNERGSFQVVRAADGYIPEVISTPEINYRLSQIGSNGLRNAIGTAFQLGGHEYYMLHVPTIATYVWDALVREWYEWTFSTNNYHKITDIISYANSSTHAGVICGLEDSDRSIYALSDTTYTDAGTAISRERASTHLHDDRNRIRLASFQVDFEAGPSTTPILSTTVATTPVVAGDTGVRVASAAGVTSGQTITIAMDSGRIHTATVTATDGTPRIFFTGLATVEGAATSNAVVVYPDERVTLEWSKNGGNTWSTPVEVHIGTVLTKRFRAFVRKLGRARNWTMRLKTTSTAKVAILGAYATVWGEDRDEPG